MAGELAKLFVEIDADTKKFNTGIDGAKKETTKFQSGLDNLAGTVKKLVGAGVLIALASKIKDVGLASIKSASDAQETQNKFDVVFSSISGYANDMATSLATSYGTSITGAKDMLAGTGDLLTGLGFTQESAFDLSQQVLTLGADLASFTNYSGGAEGASEALTKALLGEREQLKGLGISINEADLKAEVLRQTKSGLTFETEKQAKANATLTLVMNQSKNAMGDFERSEASFANQTKIARSQVENLQVELGRALLPTATKGVGVFGNLTASIVAHIKSLNDARSAYEAFKNGTETVNDKLFVVKKQIAENSVEIDKLEAMYDRATDPKFKKKWQEQLEVLYEQNQVARRVESAIRDEIKAQEDKAEAERKTQQAIDDKAKAEEDARLARIQAYVEQDNQVKSILEAHKTEIEAIDEQIAEITKLGLKDGEIKDAQLLAVKQLQADKQVILDEEAQAKEDALLAELTAQQSFDAETRAILEQARNDKAEADKKAHDDYIALKQEEAQFIQDTATSIAGIISNFNTQEITDINAKKDADILALDQEVIAKESYANEVKRINDDISITDKEGAIASIDQKAIAEQGFADAKKDIEKQSALDVWEIENKQFRIKQALSLSQIAIDTAVGVAKVWGQTGIFGLGAQIPVIAMGVAQAGLVLSQQAPQKPQLATGAYISGSQRGTEVIVGENGSDEEIFGMGTAGIPRRKQLANEVADVVLSKLGTNSGTVVNNYYQSLFSTASPSDLRKFNRINRPYAVAEEQRIGARS